MKDHQSKHQPVLLEEVLSYLAPKKSETLLDVTAGYAGHSSAILKKTGQTKGSVLVDRDLYAVEQLRKKSELEGVEIIHDDFAHASQQLNQQQRTFDLILADLGVSSPHLDNASRGFSFLREGPLDMRMDTSKGVTAADIVNSSREETLVDLLKAYGEESRAKVIARAIVDERPFSTTVELATTIADRLPRKGKIHPATKTFQALRVAVNDEIAQVRYALPLWLAMLKPGGRIAVISFHSLEDKVVKEVFKEYGGERYDAELTILTKKPVSPGNQELVFNPRARSAKLRAAVKK